MSGADNIETGNVEELCTTESPDYSLNVLQRKKRDRRSQTHYACLDEQQPQSPANCSDATFEPTIDEMVNDFDDEQTLNEEEAQAQENDAAEEIATLQEESEMPLEELLAKYGSAFAAPAPIAKPRKRSNKKYSSSSSKRAKIVSTEEHHSAEPAEPPQEAAVSEEVLAEEETTAAEVILIEDEDLNCKEDEQENESPNEDETSSEIMPMKTVTEKPLRSHLLALYPEAMQGEQAPYETLANDEDEEGEEYEDDDDDETEDSVKKTIMVGAAYQATIPIGLSQYGDVLPYENEDKLIWEPSQVGEKEVEDYLLKARDIKPTLSSSDEQSPPDLSPSNDEEESHSKTKDEVNSNINGVHSTTTNIAAQKSDSSSNEAALSDIDAGGIIKDNEQNLHLLVQCGYDFKEALRRKRLNAVPLTDSMSLWSEEECEKFEEGIQKYGKDFFKIRQHLVRTRSMREMVHFYYLWKKSERRDINFANSDTVDHMDIYLNESGDFGTNGSPQNSNSTASPLVNNFGRCPSAQNQKTFSIMTGGSTLNAMSTSALNGGNNTAAASASSSCLPAAAKHLKRKSNSSNPTHSQSNASNTAAVNASAAGACSGVAK